MDWIALIFTIIVGGGLFIAVPLLIRSAQNDLIKSKGVLRMMKYEEEKEKEQEKRNEYFKKQNKTSSLVTAELLNEINDFFLIAEISQIPRTEQDIAMAYRQDGTHFCKLCQVIGKNLFDKADDTGFYKAQAFCIKYLGGYKAYTIYDIINYYLNKHLPLEYNEN